MPYLMKASLKQGITVLIFAFSVTIPLGSSVANVYFFYPSVLNVSLTVTPVSGGAYDYSIHFVNTDSSPIWAFDLWTHENALSYSGSFPYVWYDPNASGFAEYDARNLDAGITHRALMNYPPPWPSVGLPVGGQGELRFRLRGYYESFLYGYETIASGRTVENGGYHAGGGTVVVPEPGALMIELVGCLAFLALGPVRRRLTPARVSM